VLAVSGCSRPDVRSAVARTEGTASSAAPKNSSAPVGRDEPLVSFRADDVALSVPGQPTGFAWQPGSNTVGFILHTWKSLPVCEERAVLWHFDIDTGEASPYWQDNLEWYDTHPQWSKDGNHLYFLRRELGEGPEDPPAFWRPYRCDPSGGGVEPLGHKNLAHGGRLTEAPLPESAVIVPESHLVVFTAHDPDSDGALSLFTYDYVRGEIARHAPALATLASPSARRDGSFRFWDFSLVWVYPQAGETTMAPHDDVAQRWILTAGKDSVSMFSFNFHYHRTLFEAQLDIAFPQQRPYTRSISYLANAGGVSDFGTLRIHNMSSGEDAILLPPTGEEAIRWSEPPWPTYAWESPYAWSTDGSQLVFCIRDRIYIVNVPF